MTINNLYNFKNTIRHFINIDKLADFIPTHDIKISELAWTEPINFRVRKDDNKFRTLKLPNILNFFGAHNVFKDYANFFSPNVFDPHKRLVPNIETGDFAAGEFNFQLEKDFMKLCIFDNLIKLDIKSYYGRVYTHYLDFENNDDERYLSNLNLGATNGLIMGNYISLYFGEKYLINISSDLNNLFEQNNITCSFSYFSDDFYFFCNKKDNDKIIKIFDSVLEKYDLERNDKKIEKWTYLDYNNNNLLEKYRKKIISDCKDKYSPKSDYNKLYFINQLIYRMTNLSDDKQRRIFLNTFFKSSYFHKIDFSKYYMEEYNYHQLSYIYKFCPETLLYSINKFKIFDFFTDSIFKAFLRERYIESLNTPFNEEQLYYYYAIKILGFNDILESTANKVVDCNNQLLISYYLKDNYFNSDNIDKLKELKRERYWFQNYHLILFTDLKNDLDNNIKIYLLPESIRENPNNKSAITNKQNSYINFYRNSLVSEISLINDLHEVSDNINKYINSKITERIRVFGSAD